jgi:hypothetical protein
MAITLYGLLDNSHTKINGSSRLTAGPWTNATTSVSDIAALSSSKNVIGFVDGSNRAKYFYSTAAGSINLPTLSAVPNQLPPGYVQLGTTNQSFVAGVPQEDTAGTYFIGLMFFQLTPAAGSSDAASPMLYSMDQYGLLIVDSATTEWA